MTACGLQRLLTVVTKMKTFSRALHSFAIPWFGAVICILGASSCGRTEENPAPGMNTQPASRKEVSPEVRQKLDSHLVMALKKQRGEPPFDRPTSFDPDLAVDAQGNVLVDFQATVTTALLDQIQNMGGQVISHFASMNAVRARVPLLRVETLAALPEVRFISPAAQATTNPASAAAAPSSGAAIDSSASTPITDDIKP